MFGSEKYRLFLRHPGYLKKESEAPDYTPMAEASEETAKIAADFSREQLDFAKQQYAEAKPLAQQLVSQQMAIADKTAAQGDDYYNYMKSYRPAEQALLYESMGMNADDIAALQAEQEAAASGILSGLVDDSQYKSDLEAARLALGYTPQQTSSTQTSSTTTTQPGTPAPGDGGSPMRQWFSSQKGYDPQKSVTENINTMTAANPEYAAALSKLTDAQRQALVVGLQNEKIRADAEAAKASVFNKYSGIARKREEDRIAAYDAANQADAATITADDAAIYAKNKGVIDNEVGTAIADANGQYTRSLNQAIRQGLRYGMASPAMVGKVGSLGLAQASTLASTANGTRRMGVDSVRQRAQAGLGLRQSNQNALNSEKAVGWAKKLDATGLVKGMPGASQGAYGLAVSAGNSAGQNQAAPGAQMQGAMGQSASTVLQGRSLYQQGLGSILNSQTQMAANDGGGDMLSGLGALAGGAAKMYSAGMFSDRRMKENIEAVGTDEETGLTIYEFNYLGNGRRFRGVMADEVESFMPDAVSYDDMGYAMVDYGKIGIEMEEI